LKISIIHSQVQGIPLVIHAQDADRGIKAGHSVEVNLELYCSVRPSWKAMKTPPGFSAQWIFRTSEYGRHTSY
jgi:hypothetical protein